MIFSWKKKFFRFFFSFFLFISFYHFFWGGKDWIVVQLDLLFKVTSFLNEPRLIINTSIFNF